MHRMLLVALVLVAVRTANADDPIPGHYDPPPSYCVFRYWTPRLARCYDQCYGPKLSVFAPNRHPEIEPYCIILRYPHPAVGPPATIIDPPKPPPTSRFRYGP